MKLEEIKKIVELLEKSKLHKLSLKKGDVELHLEKKQDVCPEVVYKKEVSVAKETQEVKETGTYIKSPMVGTFYASSAPGKSHFVKEGTVVSKDTVVCIIEAMKVMNEVKAGENGVIKEILCSDASPVEFGTKLFKIEKS